MSQNVPDVWDAEWTADVCLLLPRQTSILTLLAQTTESPVAPVEPKKAPGKISKAQKRAQQAEFNRQLWQQA